MKTDPNVLLLRDLQVPRSAFYTTSIKEKEGLVTDWVANADWEADGSHGIPGGVIVCGGSDSDARWGLLRKEIGLSDNCYATRITHAELAMFARHEDITPHQVVPAYLAKAGYPMDEEDNSNNTMQLGSVHFFIEHLERKVTKDMLNAEFVKDTVLLMAYYTSVYLRVSSISDLRAAQGERFVDTLLGGEIARIAVWE
jgi:hypothetical protein